MLNQDYTAKLLNLEDVIITNVENISGQLHISLELPRATHVCPACGGVTDVVHDYRMQAIKGKKYLSAPAQASLSLLLRQAFLREKRFPRPLPWVGSILWLLTMLSRSASILPAEFLRKLALAGELQKMADIAKAQI